MAPLDNAEFLSDFRIMAGSLERIYEEARDLPPAALATLVEKLIETMEVDLAPEDERAHLLEISRRRQGIADGASLIPGDVALRRGRQVLKG